MTKPEFIPIYKDLVSICGEPHRDKEMNTRHRDQMLASLQRWDTEVVKQAVTRIIRTFGRTQFDTRWPTPGMINGVCEDIHQGQNRGVFEEEKSCDRRRQEAELLRIDRAIDSLSVEDRHAMNNEAAIRVLEPITKKVAALVKGRTAPCRNEDESDYNWAIRLAMWLGELREAARLGRVHQGTMGTFTAEYLVLMCRELYEARIIMTMREIAKERGVI